MTIFDVDDDYLVGPIDRLMEVVVVFHLRLWKYVGSTLNEIKCELRCRDISVVEEYLQRHPDSQFRMDSILIPDGSKTHGVQVSGVPFGNETYVQSKM